MLLFEKEAALKHHLQIYSLFWNAKCSKRGFSICLLTNSLIISQQKKKNRQAMHYFRKPECCRHGGFPKCTDPSGPAPHQGSPSLHFELHLTIEARLVPYFDGWKMNPWCCLRELSNVTPGMHFPTYASHKCNSPHHQNHHLPDFPSTFLISPLCAYTHAYTHKLLFTGMSVTAIYAREGWTSFLSVSREVTNCRCKYMAGHWDLLSGAVGQKGRVSSVVVPSIRKKSIKK